MLASVVIPVWNGASVVGDCLAALYAHSGDGLLEVICVDNASHDGSAGLIAGQYPQARLIRQPVNLGFAGGVNAGVEAAQGEVFCLVNQDCLVAPGWLDALARALATRPEIGVAGCTILNADGSLNHTGAAIRRPGAYGDHLAEPDGDEPRPADFVTGAAMAIRRRTWEAVGRFDEGFYPGYYEDADYCYRARQRGFEVVYVPQARATHLLSSEAWRADLFKHSANQHRARYRFVGKHFDPDELTAFFEAEWASAEEEPYLDQAVGRLLAARDTLRALPDILERRRADLASVLPAAGRRHLQVGLTGVLRRSLATAQKLSLVGLGESPREAWRTTQAEIEQRLGELFPPEGPAASPPLETEAYRQAEHAIQALQQRQHDLLARIHFRSPSADGPEPAWRRFLRLFVLRPLSFLIGRDYLLLAQLNAVHVARLDALQHKERLYQERVRQALDTYNARLELLGQILGPLAQEGATKQEQLLDHHRQEFDRRLKLLEILVDYDYR
ncbi:MAG: glycosyltransferase [Anaerolineae bacterium]|jgi:GT2 family glycosyltransferase